MKKWLLLVPAIASLAIGTFILIKKDYEEEGEDTAGKDQNKKTVSSPRKGYYSLVSV